MINETDIQKLTELIGVKFSDPGLITEALTHRSFINEHKSSRSRHNERLEFLGDAVLELVVTNFLFSKYPDRPEGDLTSFRAALVRTESLASAAQKLKLGEFLFMSKGEESTGGRNRQYILANAFEALIGAIYLDQGMEAVSDFLQRELLPNIEAIVEQRLDVDPKSKLQEIAQEQLKQTPSYQLLSESGPDHDKTFVMDVRVGDEVFGEGSGKSKQEAEQQAARNALNNWEKLYQKYKNSATITGN